jgi:hypothetical protein
MTPKINNVSPIKNTVQASKAKKAHFAGFVETFKKDRFVRESTSSRFRTQEISHHQVNIDVSTNEPARVWWSVDLSKELSDNFAPDTHPNEPGIAQRKLFDTLKSLANDKGYLRVNLLDDVTI